MTFRSDLEANPTYILKNYGKSGPAWGKIEDTFTYKKLKLPKLLTGAPCDSSKLLNIVSFYHILGIVISTPQGVEVEELLNKDEHLVTTDVLQKNNKN